MNSVETDVAIAMDDPLSGSSLVPMLVSGLVLIVVGMIAVAAFS
jgi:hypothetical protein